MNRLIEAMAMTVRGKLEERLLNAHTAKDVLEFAEELAQAALTAALATGSVVICTPELKALMEAALTFSKKAKMGPYSTSIPLASAALAFARIFQES